jgi:anti-sigma B factor antagonist
MTLESEFIATTYGTDASQLQVFVSRVECTTRVVLAGELDGASAVSLSDRLTQTAADLVGDLVIDIGLLTFIDSTGLSLLVSLHQQVRASGYALTVAEPTPMARRLFQITALDNVLTVVPGFRT